MTLQEVADNHSVKAILGERNNASRIMSAGQRAAARVKDRCSRDLQAIGGQSTYLDEVDEIAQ